MKWTLAIALSLSCAVSSVLSADEKPLNTPPEGYTALFNGKDLTGWKGLVGNGNPYAIKEMSAQELSKAQKAADQQMREHWSVQDGILIYDGKGKSLVTAKDYKNFELLLDWKILQEGDSGIYLRGTPQVQIWDADAPALFKHGADKGSGSLWNNKDNPRFPLVKADKPFGQWNHFKIRMVGEKVSVWLNDQLVTDNVTLENFWKRDQPVLESGTIELQHHGNKLEFRNIYVKELE